LRLKSMRGRCQELAESVRHQEREK
jgi:hypothetical protein